MNVEKVKPKAAIVSQTVQSVQAGHVEKALSDDEKAIIGDIRSLLDKLGQLETSEGQGVTEKPEGGEPDELLQMAMKAAEALGIGEDGEPKKPEDEGAKAAKATASDPAEQRLDDNPDADAALKLIGKALMGLMPNTAKVAKSARTEIDQGMVGLLGKISEQMTMNTQAIQGILEGIGAADLIQKAEKPAPSRAIQQTPNALAQALSLILKSQGTVGETATEDAEGGLGYVLKALAKAGPQQVGEGNR